LTTTDFALTTADGKELFGKQWVPQEPMSVVCLVHGLGEHIGRFDHVAKHLNQAGIAVYGIDQRGHGRSPGKRGHARCSNLWDDVESLMKHARLLHLDLPLFLYGHSWGGNIVSNFLLRKNSSEIRGAVLSSPWLKLSFEPSKFELMIGKWMAKVYPAFTKSNGLEAASLSRDVSVGEAYINDPLVHFRISAGLFADADANGQYALDHAELLNKPVLVMHGTSDQITSHKASETFAQAALSNATLKLWPDMRHETHNEFGKEEVLEYLTKWLVKMTV
jgi:alpha-beta hydrolase superfamily lysophospholipase